MHKDIVEVDWLIDHLNNDSIIILDVSPKTTASNKSYAPPIEIIPGARVVSIKQQFSDQESEWPNTIPTAEDFELSARSLGINNDSHIIVYDSIGVYTSPRVWWLFKIMGHLTVSVLNGGLPAWKEQQYPSSPKPFKNPIYAPGNFVAQFNNHKHFTYENVEENLNSKVYQLVDARSSGRFNGLDDEPRKNLKSGHISKSINIPYSSVLSSGKFKSENELKKIFESHINQDQALVYTCGSGMTACIVLLANYLTYNQSLHVFDGSWTEWATRQGLTK